MKFPHSHNGTGLPAQRLRAAEFCAVAAVAGALTFGMLAPPALAASARPPAAVSNTGRLPYVTPEWMIDKNLPFSVNWGVRTADVRTCLPDEALGDKLSVDAPYEHGAGMTWKQALEAGDLPRVPGDNSLADSPRAFFIGRKVDEGPVELVTDPVLGPGTQTYSIGTSVSNQHESDHGWTAGGAIGVDVGGTQASVSGSYTRSAKDSTDYTSQRSQSAQFTVPNGKYASVEVRTAGADYLGYFISWDGAHWQAAPAKAFVKAPGITYSATWQQVVYNTDGGKPGTVYSRGPEHPVGGTDASSPIHPTQWKG